MERSAAGPLNRGKVEEGTVGERRAIGDAVTDQENRMNWAGMEYVA